MNENQNEYVDINAHDNYPDSEQKIEIPTMKVIPLKKICMTIGALPTSYLETLSYYEMLVWFIEFLKNNIIPTINNNASAIQEVQSVVLALQNYINNYKDSIDSDVEELEEYMNNYFENLDVQEEINNKLDQMLEDGVLTEIIQQFLQSTAIWCFDTVADMKNATNLIDGSFARTLGYYSVNDGGEAIYKITDTESLSDYQEELTSGLYATLITNNEVNLMQFGCYGNGVNDDTNKIKEAITYAETNNLTIVSSINKTYLLSDDINISNINIDLENSTFKTDNTLIISASGKVLDLPLVKSISDLSNNTGINIFESNNCIINVPLIEGFNVGLKLSSNTKGCFSNQITINQILNCLTFLLLDAGTSGWVNENLFIGGRLWATTPFNTLHASDIIKIYLKGNSNHLINNNYFLKQDIEGNEGSSNGLKLKIDYSTDNEFNNLRYEGTSPKVDITNSYRVYLNNGFNINNLSFLNQIPTISLGGNYNKVASGGSTNGVYSDVRMGSNGYASYQTRRIDDTIASKITPNGGFITCDNSGNELARYLNGAIEYYRDNSYQYILRPYGKWTLLANCDFTNGGLVINSGSNVTNGCYLWLHDGHLKGKIGTPSTAEDGTIIL